MSTNELAISQPTAVAATPNTLSISSALEEQVRQLDNAYTLAKSLCKTALCPQTFRGKPEDGAVAIMAGAKWGLDAIASLQNIFVVHGTPSTYAKVMKAVVLANGHKIWTVESSPTKVVVRGKRSDSDEIEESVWTIERARKAGLFTNKKYDTEPENMLWSRATAEASRRTAPDCLLGMPYSREELEDSRPVRATSQRMDAGSGIANSLGIVPTVEPEPADVTHLQEAPSDPVTEPEPAQVSTSVDEPIDATVDEPAAEPQPEPGPALCTVQQQKAIANVLNKEGLATTAKKVEYLTTSLHREITAIKDVTEAEAAELIDYLQTAQAADDAKQAQQ